jgi:glycosyltransferase involved in cell wall biosynthesis
MDIMLPAYGDGALVRETIASVLAQDDQDWHLTVIDDGAQVSTHDLKSWVTDLGDPRIRYLANPHRVGLNRNFQRCADEATADLVLVIGSDDRLLPDLVSRVRKAAAANPDAAFIHTGATVIDENGEPAMPLVDRVKRLTSLRFDDAQRQRGWQLTGGETLASSLLRGNWMYFPSVVFRRDVLQRHGFREGFDIVLDLDLYLRILMEGGQAVLFSEPGIEYRRHSASLSSATADDGSRFDEEQRYFAETAAAMAELGWPKAARAARWHLTSRLHAVTKTPGLLAARKFKPAASMLKAAFGGVGTAPPKPEAK